eukprot:GHVP01020622.1.p1 GENE.GHVP01020622.1~~GHVP01020622.1.p1  ORF type:complete len:146 (-),score=11.54 GHVP01020622.1:65-502(-)
MDDWKSEIEKRDIQFKSQEKISDLQCSSEIERMTFKWTIHKLSELQQMAKDPVLSGVYKLKTPVYTIVKEGWGGGLTFIFTSRFCFLLLYTAKDNNIKISKTNYHIPTQTPGTSILLPTPTIRTTVPTRRFTTRRFQFHSLMCCV